MAPCRPLIALLALAQLAVGALLEENETYTGCLAEPSACDRLHFLGHSLEGTVPTEVGTLTSLTYLGLHYNLLVGTVPTEVGNLKLLSAIGLHYNSLAGTVPTEIGLLTALVTIGLNTNSLAGTLPTELGVMAGLVGMNSTQNALTGTLPTEIGLMPKLKEALFASTSLDGTLPTELGAIAGRLKRMDVSRTSMWGGAHGVQGVVPPVLPDAAGSEASGAGELKAEL